MKKIFYFLSIIILLTTTNSCSNFDELNTDPDASTIVSSDMLATQVLKGTYRFWNPNPTDFATGNLWNKHIAVLETMPIRINIIILIGPMVDLTITLI